MHYRYDSGICDEKGNVVAVFTRGWWYEPKKNRLGLLELESCSKEQCAKYEATPLVASVKQVLILHPTKNVENQKPSKSP